MMLARLARVAYNAVREQAEVETGYEPMVDSPRRSGGGSDELEPFALSFRVTTQGPQRRTFTVTVTEDVQVR